MYNTMLINGGRQLLHRIIYAYAPLPILRLTVKVADIDSEVIERDIGNAAQFGPCYSPNGSSD